MTQKGDRVLKYSVLSLSKTTGLNFITAKYFLHYSSKTILHQNNDSPFMCNGHSLILRPTWFHQSGV